MVHFGMINSPHRRSNIVMGDENYWSISVPFPELIPQVQEQLEMVTKKVAQDKRRADFNTVPVGDRLKTEDAPMQYNMWSTDPAAIPLPRGIQRG